jgi:hypothetical protein
MDRLICLLAVAAVQALNKTGQKTNAEYKINEYYGSRDRGGRP